MTTPPIDFQFAKDPNAVWFITGCSSGFGRALAEEVARRGLRLVATARDLASLENLDAAGPNVLKAVLDVTKPETISRAVESALTSFGRIDTVVNNAGIGVIGPMEDITDAQTRHQFEVNVFGVFNVIRATAPVFRAQNRGLYINFASMAGERSYWSLGVYAASKFAVEGISEAVVQEMASFGVSALIVEPGPFDTEWFWKNAIWAEEHRDRYADTWDKADGMRAVYSDRTNVGDPALAARAILEAVSLDPRPMRLPLHEYAVASIREKVQSLQNDLELTSHLSLAIHYPRRGEGDSGATRQEALSAGAAS